MKAKKPRNPIAKSLRSPHLRQRVKPSKKTFTRAQGVATLRKILAAAAGQQPPF